MEWIRILYKQNIIWAGCLLMVLNLFVFLYMQVFDENNQSRSLQEHEKEYVETYYDSQQEIIKQADQMNLISLFSTSGSFSEKNGEKTKKDFKKILSIQPVYFENAYLINFFQYWGMDLFALIGCLLIAFGLSEKGQGKTKNLIYSTVYGRGKMTWAKIISLFMWVAVIVFLFYIETICVSCFFYKRNLFSDMFYPIQSLSMYRNLILQVTIGEFLGLLYLYKVVTVYIVVLFAWLVLYFMDHILFAGGLMFAVGISKFGCYYFIGENHPLNYFHYCNMFYILGGRKFFEEYKNVKIFSEAVNKNSMIVCSLLIVCLVMIFTAVVLSIKIYPGDFLFKKKRQCRNGKGNGILISCSPWLTELKKIFVCQKAVVLVIIYVVFLVVETDANQLQMSESQILYDEFIDKYKGIPGIESEKEINNLSEMLARVQESYNQKNREYESGKLNEEEWIEVSFWYDTFQGKRIFLQQIQEQTDYLLQLKKKGVEGWYVNVYGYHHLFNDDETIPIIILIILVVLINSVIFGYEKKSGMNTMLRCSENGRGKLYGWKVAASCSCTLFLYLLFLIQEIVHMSLVYRTDGWNAPVQSLPLLYFVEVNCSIREFYIFLCLVRGCVLLAIASITLYVSIRKGKWWKICFLLVILIPDILGLNGNRRLNSFNAMNIALVFPVLYEYETIKVMIMIFVVCVACVMFFIHRIYRNWCDLRGRNV